jgi:hypothetical protein
MGLVWQVWTDSHRSSHRPPGAEEIPFYSWCFVLDGRPPSGNFIEPQVWRVMLSLHLRLSLYDDKILPLYCWQCHTTMDSAGAHATLSCHRAPCGWISRHEHVKKIIAREGLRAAGLNCAFEVPILIPNSDKLPDDLFAWRRHPLRTLCRAIPPWTYGSIFTSYCSSAACGGETWTIGYIC